MSVPISSDRPVPRAMVEAQLKSILRSDAFAGGGALKKAERLGQLLAFIVEQTLNGVVVTDNILLLDFFNRPPSAIAEGNANARISILRLRKKLTLFYQTQGLNDPVIIEIPFGQSGARFRLNPTTYAQKEIRLGFYHVDRETPSDIRLAISHFENAIAHEPNLAEGSAGLASAFLTMTLHAYTEDPGDLFEKAEEAAKTAKSLDATCWQAHANLGAVHLFRHEWSDADFAFAEAERLNAFELDSIGGYGPYLLSRGRYESGRDLAARYLDIGFDDVVLVGRAALYLYALRDFDEARRALDIALQLEPHFWRSHMLLAFVDLAQGNPESALSHMLQVSPLTQMNLWPGLRVLCLESAGRSADAQTEFLQLEEASKRQYIQPMQLALGHMALGNAAEAISCLSLACDEGDPFTAWLHLWPFLDPLRRFAEFRALLRKWKFPDR